MHHVLCIIRPNNHCDSKTHDYRAFRHLNWEIETMKAAATSYHAHEKRDFLAVRELWSLVTLSPPIPRIQNGPGPARPDNLSRLVPPSVNQKNIPKQNRRSSQSLSGRQRPYEKRRQVNPPRRSRNIGRRRGRTGRKERALSINPRFQKNQNPRQRITGKKPDQNGAKEKAPFPNLVREILKS